MVRSNGRPTACAPLPFFSPSPSEVISKAIPNAAFEKRDYSDVFPPVQMSLSSLLRRSSSLTSCSKSEKKV